MRPVAILTVFFGLASLAASAARAQTEVRNLAEPQLAYTALGHTAPVRSLIFTPDGKQLLSAGQDKIINVWNFENGALRYARTIRPPVWRGKRGYIYCMAISPTPIAEDPAERWLAVGGVSATAGFSAILLYKFPGTGNLKTGEVVAQLPSLEGNPTTEGHADAVLSLAFTTDGRSLVSGGLDGKLKVWDLATKKPRDLAYQHLDRSIIAHPGGVTKLAICRKSARVWSGGEDGVLCLWDLDPKAPKPLLWTRPHPNPAADARVNAIKALALSPDESVIVVGREGGRLERYNLTTGAVTELIVPAERRPIEDLAISPDGKSLAVSLVRNLHLAPPVDSVVQIWNLADGRLVEETPTLKRRIWTCAFHPIAAAQTLAYAGGERQSIYLKKPGIDQPVENGGDGAAVWKVGFAEGDMAVSFSRRNRTSEGVEIEEIKTFDFKAKSLSDAPSLPAAIGWNNWSIRAHPFQHDNYETELMVVDPAGKVVDTLRWERTRVHVFGPWWSYALIPPPRGGMQPAVAVGCDADILVFAPDSARPNPFDRNQRLYRRTRVLRGHNAEVYSLAVKPAVPGDAGPRLVSSSIDQTVRLWSLAHAFTPPELGASFVVPIPNDGTLVVADVQSASPAEEAGLKAGDRILDVAVARDLFGIRPFAKVTPAQTNQQFLDKYTVSRTGKPTERLFNSDAIDPDFVRAPGSVIQFVFKDGKTGEERMTSTSRYDNPLVSLFATAKNQWVAWLPEGYYETSIQGDEYLGWHRNPPSMKSAVANLTNPTDFMPISRFEGLFRKPALIDHALSPTSPKVPRIDVDDRSWWPQAPLVAIGSPLDAQKQVIFRRDLPLDSRDQPLPNPLPLLVTAMSPEGKGALPAESISAIRALSNGQPVARVTKPGKWPVALKIPLAEGPQRITVEAETDDEQVGDVKLDVAYHYLAPPPPRMRRAPQLVVLAIGSGQFQGGAFPDIKTAAKDALDFGEKVIYSKVIQGYHSKKGAGDGLAPPPPMTLVDAMGKKDLEARLDEFRSIAHGLEPRDTVVVFVEAHVLEEAARSLKQDQAAALGPRDKVDALLKEHAAARKTRLIARDTNPATLEATAFDTDRLTALLGDIVSEKRCTVVVLLDGLHGIPGQLAPDRWSPGVREWTRELLRKNVIVEVASTDGPARPWTDKNSVFYNALVDCCTTNQWWSKRALARAPRSLDLAEFDYLIHKLVVDKTKQGNHPQQAWLFVPPTISDQTLFLQPPLVSEELAKKEDGRR